MALKSDVPITVVKLNRKLMSGSCEIMFGLFSVELKSIVY